MYIVKACQTKQRCKLYHDQLFIDTVATRPNIVISNKSEHFKQVGIATFLIRAKERLGLSFAVQSYNCLLS